MEVYKWSTTAGSNNSAVPDGAPEGWTGANVNNWARETMAQVRAQASDASYIDETYQLASVGTKTLVRDSTTQFTVQACDATSVFTAGRRIRVVGATTDYGYVVSSSYSTNTTVTVTMESGDVPSTPTQALVHVDAKIKSGAYSQQGAGNGLDADTVDGYGAAEIFGPSIFADALVNGSFLVWQRGTSSTSASAGSNTFLADRWFTNPTDAAVTVERTTTTPTGAVSPYAIKITGNTGVTACAMVGQRIESYLIPYIKTTVTFSALVKNDTSGTANVFLVLGTPTAQDDFTTVTNRLTAAFGSVSSGTTSRLTYTVDISGYTNLANGLEMKMSVGALTLDDVAKSITITEVQIDRVETFSYFRFRPFQDELLRCQRYYTKTFDYATAPAANWDPGNGAHVGAITIPGSSAASAPNTGASWVLPTVMRAAPTVATYNPRSGTADEACRYDATATTYAVTATAGTGVVTLSVDGPTVATCIGATASAEL